MSVVSRKDDAVSVWGIAMFRDEEDVAEHVVRHLAEEGFDGVLIADNNSVDGTAKRLADLAQELDGSCRVVVIEDPEIGYYQSAKMTKLAAAAHNEFGADWIVPFDADEVWYSRTTTRLAETLTALPPIVGWITATLFNHFPSALDPVGDNPFETIQWREAGPGKLPKIAFRYDDAAVIQMGNHAVVGAGIGAGADLGIEIRHFPYRSFEQFMRKARNGEEAYAATDLSPDFGAHWRGYATILRNYGEDVLRRDVFEKYFWFLSPVDEGMVWDPAPFRRWARLNGTY